MDEKIISFDLGTGGNKASLYDVERQLPGERLRALRHRLSAGWLARATPGGLVERGGRKHAQAAAASGVNKKRIAGLGISGHSLGAVPVDKRRQPAARRHPHLVGYPRAGGSGGILQTMRSGRMVPDHR